MLYKWLETQDKNVKNFNKIFNLSKLEGFKDEEKVAIGDIHTGELREVTVKNRTRTMELRSSNMTCLVSGHVNSISNVKPKITKKQQEIMDAIKTLGGTANISDINRVSKISRQIIEKRINTLKNNGYLEVSKTKGIVNNTPILLCKLRQ
jgi:hypothetical protein